MEGGCVSLREIISSYPTGDRKSIWLLYPNGRNTYIENVGKFSSTPVGSRERERIVNACLITSLDDSVRLGTAGQEIMKSILIAIGSFHECNQYLGNCISPDNIYFAPGDYSKAYFDAAVTGGRLGKADDYLRVNNSILPFFIQHFGIVQNQIPMEIIDFRGELQKSPLREDHIKNHYCLWDSRKRRSVVMMVGDLCQNEDYKESTSQTNLMVIAFDNLDVLYPNFNLKYYVSYKLNIAGSICYMKNTSFWGLIEMMRHVYYHRKYDKMLRVYKTTEALEYDLHATYPFAFYEICRALDQQGILADFWTMGREIL